MVFEFVQDTENGTESLVIDSCEMTAWRVGSAPSWVPRVKELMAERQATADAALARIGDKPIVVN